jgi:transposase
MVSDLSGLLRRGEHGVEGTFSMAKRRQFSAQFKAAVALEALRGELTMAELAKKHDVHPNMIAGWKRRLSEEAAGVFARARTRRTGPRRRRSRSCTRRSGS